MARDTPPRVVAELGRPETADETIARKTEARRLRRQNQTAFNLLIATLFSAGIALFIGLLLSNAGDGEVDVVDYAGVAADAQQDVDVPLTVPELPDGWRANRAELRNDGDGVRSWRIGFITPENEYIGLSQGIGADDAWLTAALDEALATGEVQAGGTWTVHDQRARPDIGNAAYALSAAFPDLDGGGSPVVLQGTASDAEFVVLAESVAESLDARATATGATP
jgi:hypothetical protein